MSDIGIAPGIGAFLVGLALIALDLLLLAPLDLGAGRDGRGRGGGAHGAPDPARLTSARQPALDS